MRTTLEGCINTITFCKSTFLLTFYVNRVCSIKLLWAMQKWYKFISFRDTRYPSRSRLLLTPITSALWSRNTEHSTMTHYLWGFYVIWFCILVRLCALNRYIVNEGACVSLVRNLILYYKEKFTILYKWIFYTKLLFICFILCKYSNG